MQLRLFIVDFFELLSEVRLDSDFCEFVAKKIQDELEGESIFSKKYIFDRKYAKHRNQYALKSEGIGFETRLSFIVFYALTKERRERIFQSIFDLGNTRPHPPELCSRSNLATEIAEHVVTGTEAKDLFDTIFQGVFKITGRKIHEFSSINELKTLKVIKTLHCLSIARNSRLMQLLQSPQLGGKFSYSLRSDYPYIESQEQVWLIADLQTYLSIELNKEEARRVNLFFRQMNERFGKLIQESEKKLEKASGQSIDKIIKDLGLLNLAVESFDVQSQCRIFELDHELLVHVSKLPFLHYAVGYRHLLNCAKPNLVVAPIGDEFIVLIRKIFPGLKTTATKFDAVIAIKDIPEFILRWESEILEVVQRAFGDDFKMRKLEKVMPNILSLFRLYNLFRFGLEADRCSNVSFSFWTVFVAVCSVLYSLNYPLTFRPYWLGQEMQGGSINNSNLINDEEFSQAVDFQPEEHRFILFHRMEWFIEALDGNVDLIGRKFDFRSAVVEKLLHFCRTNDIDQISQSFTNFEEHIDREISNFFTPSVTSDYRPEFVQWFIHTDEVFWQGKLINTF